MAETYKGSKFHFKIGTNTFGCLGSFEFNSTTSEEEATCTESGTGQEFVEGLDSETLSGSGTIRKISAAEDATQIGAFELLAMKDARTRLTFVFGGIDVGDDVLTGTFFLTNVTYSKGAPGAAPTFSFTGRVLPGRTIAKVLAA